VAGSTDARRAALTMRRTPEDEQQLAWFLEPARAALGDVAFDVARRAGATLSVPDALQEVTSLRLLASESTVVEG
jgi:hypothetical protein